MYFRPTTFVTLTIVLLEQVPAYVLTGLADALDSIFFAYFPTPYEILKLKLLLTKMIAKFLMWYAAFFTAIQTIDSFYFYTTSIIVCSET